MKRWVLILLFLVIVAAVYALERQSSIPSTHVGEQPVLVELFTSQGCSSCPPADELLRRIAQDPQLRGRVIPLAFHVDYWDHLGWRDPFSSREWSQRQGDYSNVMHRDGVYTPQVVINGSREMVGSNSAQIYRAIEEESKRKPEGSVAIRRDGGELVVRANGPRDAEVIVAVFENGASTNVLRGENGGRRIANDAIVRKLVHVGKGTLEQRVKVTLGPRMGAVAFLQDAQTLRVLAATPPVS